MKLFSLIIDVDQSQPRFSSIYERTQEFLKDLEFGEYLEYEFGNVYSKVFGKLSEEHFNAYIAMLQKYKVQGLRFYGKTAREFVLDGDI